MSKRECDPQDILNNIAKGTPLYHHERPKCANPACPSAFHWLQGGKFFRFRSEPVSTGTNEAAKDLAEGIHGVRHYWLCETCSRVFTLVHVQEQGVVLKLRWPAAPADEAENQSRVA
jgi:hypothetical protein